MGQHKYNPNCQLAREGKLPPKPPKKPKRQVERELYAMCYDYMMSATGLGRAMEMAGVDVNQRRKEDLETYEFMQKCRF